MKIDQHSSQKKKKEIRPTWWVMGQKCVKSIKSKKSLQIYCDKSEKCTHKKRLKVFFFWQKGWEVTK